MSGCNNSKNYKKRDCGCGRRRCDCNKRNSLCYNRREPLVSLFDRLIVQTTDITRPASPSPNVLDLNHAQMLASGLYTQAQINQFQVDSFAYFLATFGLDFNTAVIAPGGIFILVIPGGSATLIPYATGVDGVHKLAFDSKYPQRGQDGDWVFETFGNLVAFSGTGGTFTSGTAAGQNWKNNDIVFYLETNALKVGENRSNPCFREVFKLRSFAPSQQVFNSYTPPPVPPSPNPGLTEQHSKFYIIDECGNTGYGTLEVVVDQITTTPPNFIVNQKNRGVYTWNCNLAA